MATKDWNGFKKSGDTYIPNDATARAGVIANTKLIKDTVGWSGKNKANFVSGKGINSSGEVINTEGRIATVQPITIKSGMQYKYVSAITENIPLCIYAVWNGSTLVRREAGIESGAVLNTSGGDKLYVCVYGRSSTSITIDSAKAMVIDANVVDDTYEPYFGSTAFPRSEQAILGAKNVFDYNAGKSTTTTTYTATNNGKNINVASISNGTYRGITLNFNVNKNTDYRLSTNVTITSGHAGIKIQQTDSTAIKTESITSSGKKTFTFNSGDNEVLQMVLFCTWSTSEAGNIDYNDLIIQLASDNDDTYVPYAMTNKELTPAIFEATTAFTFDTNGKSITKQGNMVVPYLRVTGVTATADDTTTPICVVPEECRPSFAKGFPIISSGTITSATLYTDGKIVAKTTLSNATVTISNPWSI